MKSTLDFDFARKHFNLSYREFELLLLAAKSLKRREISEQMGIKYQNFGYISSSVKSKLEAKRWLARYTTYGNFSLMKKILPEAGQLSTRLQRNR